MFSEPSLFAAAALLSCVLASSALAEVKTAEVEYKQGDTVLQGFVAWDDAISGKRPGVLVVHEWWGHNKHAREQAQRIAAAGYVAFALDMYGKGKVATHPNDAKAFMAEATADFKVERARFDAALAQLKKRPEVNAKQIGAVGYCFGGAVALEMARAGTPLAFVATFHGALGTKTPARKGFKPRVLVLNGAADPMVPKEQVDAFKQEMTAAGAKFQVIDYPGVKHAFTNRDADKVGMPALAYDAAADKASFEEFRKLMSELYPPPKAAAATPAAKPAAAKPAVASPEAARP
jgi:dienelactone hydrolase